MKIWKNKAYEKLKFNNSNYQIKYLKINQLKKNRNKIKILEIQKSKSNNCLKKKILI